VRIVAESLSLKAYAKINLALDIIGKRADNYHEVAMIMQSIGLFDVITLENAPSGITLTTDNPNLSVGGDNIAHRAALLFKEHCRIENGVKIMIEKKIPLAAGLAGGSTDAAATLVGLAKLWGLSLSLTEFDYLGAKLGSDVPFCLHGGTMLAVGRGEIVTPLPPLPKCYVILAKPSASVSTAWAYANFQKGGGKRPDLDAMRVSLEKGDLKGVAALLGNALETVTIKAYPQIALLKARMIEYGAMAAMMSGSGPTVFGLAETEKEGRFILEKLKESDGSDCELFVTETIYCNA